MSLSCSDVMFLITTIFVVHQFQQHGSSAREFTADCTKNPDGRFLCARTLAGPDVQVAPPQGMSGHFGCTMSCTLDENCRHFNHVSSPATMQSRCELFYGKANSFHVTQHCEHYHAPTAGARAP